MVKNLIPIPDKWRKCRFKCWFYWFPHWLAVNVIAIRHKCWHPRFLLHDIDKPCRLTFLGSPYAIVNALHKSTKGHHTFETRLDRIEAICDWQASGYTKPDALLNARETLNAYHKDEEDLFLPILDEYKF